MRALASNEGEGGPPPEISKISPLCFNAVSDVSLIKNHNFSDFLSRQGTNNKMSGWYRLPTRGKDGALTEIFPYSLSHFRTMKSKKSHFSGFFRQSGINK